MQEMVEGEITKQQKMGTERESESYILELATPHHFLPYFPELMRYSVQGKSEVGRQKRSKEGHIWPSHEL